MVNSQIYNLLVPIKEKTILKIHQNLHKSKSQLNIIKASVPELNVHGTFERTFTTLLGYTLQDIAEKCGSGVINVDNDSKTMGIDLRTMFGEGQLKSNKNTQTGTHAKDSIQKLKETTLKNQTQPFFAIAFGESAEYTKNGILYLVGDQFWSKIDVKYDDLYDTISHVTQETYAEVKSTILSTL
jgi:hypothetical protein